MLARLLTLVAIATVAYVPAAQSSPAVTPTGLRAFLLRADEPTVTSFPRTPAFAWEPYDGAVSYDFQLATSKKFDDRSMVWSTASRSEPLRVPAVTVPISLPWMTGHPYALYARVRARTAAGVSRWSAPFGFNMQWSPTEGPQRLPDVPGLVRWTPVAGATSYEVWFVNADKVVSTTTNVADEREYYTGHPDQAWSGVVEWRVRAVRKLYGALPNALPAVSYGPWSETYVSMNPPLAPGRLALTSTESDVVGTPASPGTHVLTPGFAFGGNTADNGVSGQLFRVYVSTDRQCVNIVFTGSIVGSPAYAPRTSGPLAVPAPATPVTTYLPDGPQSGMLGADAEVVTTNEDKDTSSSGSATTTSGTTTSTIPSDFTTDGPFVDLWDLGRPSARYWWTVVPVVPEGTTYRDAELPQDACEHGLVMPFAKTTAPATASTTRPFVSGMSAIGDLVAARSRKPSFYRAPLVAWEPVPGAIGYEVQWSKTENPFRPASKTPYYTAATSALLEDLSPGTWYYRVRGIDPYIPGPIKQMTWSAPVRVTIDKPTFVVQSGVTTKPA